MLKYIQKLIWKQTDLDMAGGLTKPVLKPANKSVFTGARRCGLLENMAAGLAGQ